ncbi:MAG: hypothetical protein P8124_06700, partial [Gammaproteobacteria bacterium]
TLQQCLRAVHVCQGQQDSRGRRRHGYSGHQDRYPPPPPPGGVQGQPYPPPPPPGSPPPSDDGASG